MSDLSGSLRPFLRSAARWIVAMAVVAVAVAYVVAGAANPWDFQTYYDAASAYRVHLSPYSLEALSRVAGKGIELPFLYPPITLSIFLPLSLLPLQVAAGVWLGAKVVLLVLLARSWRRDFLPSTDPIVVLATTLLGFNLALLWDLRTGNVAVVEAALLWLAFSSYLRSRVALTGYLIALASVFKLIPALLLGLVALAPVTRRRKWAVILGCLVLLVASVSVPFHLAAEWRQAVAGSSMDRPTGDINPSALGISDWLAAALELPATTAPVLAVVFYLVYCAIVLLSSLAAILRAMSAGSRREQVVLLVLLWLLVSPRVMVYSFVMAIVPVLYVIETRIRPGVPRAASVLVLLLQGLIRLLPGRPPEFLAPVSFLILLAAWLLTLRRAPAAAGTAPA